MPKTTSDWARTANTNVDAALAELERLEEGGFAPNYTPTATVDNDSGIIVDAGVLAHTDEDKHMLASVANDHDQEEGWHDVNDFQQKRFRV